jgi:hypothetical protein
MAEGLKGIESVAYGSLVDYFKSGTLLSSVMITIRPEVGSIIIKLFF